MKPFNRAQRVARAKTSVAKLLACGVLAFGTPWTLAQTSVDTFSSWDGVSFISSFGVTDTATYGQVITVAPGASALNSFSFQIGHCGAAVTLRGSVYAWDGAKATGPSLYTSAPRTLANSPAFQLVTFAPGPLALPPGQYVLFASTSDDQAGAPLSSCRWGAVADTSYAGGQFVFMNNWTNTALWTAQTWLRMPRDLALRVVGLYAPPAAVNPVPTLGEWGLLALGLAAAGAGAGAGAQRLRRRA